MYQLDETKVDEALQSAKQLIHDVQVSGFERIVLDKFPSYADFRDKWLAFSTNVRRNQLGHCEAEEPMCPPHKQTTTCYNWKPLDVDKTSKQL